MQWTINSHWGKLQQGQRIHELLRYRSYIGLWRKKGEEKGREEKLELGAEGKKRGRRLRGRGSARVSARQRIVRVLHLHCAQMFANVNSQWMLYIVQRTTYNMITVRPANGGLLAPWGCNPTLGKIRHDGRCTTSRVPFNIISPFFANNDHFRKRRSYLVVKEWSINFFLG